jgi:CubicO group peptidase (beta-lactamase class C family)
MMARTDENAMRQILRIVLALAAVLAIPLHAADNDSLGPKIDQFVKAEMQRQHVPGVAVAVIKDGQVI